MANLDQMSGTFLNNANRDSGLGTNSSDIAAIRGAGMGWGRLTDWILGMMGQNNEGNSLNGEGWADPIPQLQTTGGAMLGAGGALVAAAKAGEGYSSKPGAAAGKPAGKPFAKPGAKPFGKPGGKPAGKPFGKPRGAPKGGKD